MHLAGAAAGSMIAYLTGLTPLDPTEHALFSERFMGPLAIEVPGVESQGTPEGSVPDCFGANTSMTPQEFVVVLRRLGYSLSVMHDPTPEMFVSVHARRRAVAGGRQTSQLLVSSSPTDALANMVGEVSCEVLDSDCQTWQLLHMGDTDGIDELNTSVLRDVLQEHEPASLLALADVLAYTRHGTVHGSEHGCPYLTVYEEDVMHLLGDAMRIGLRESLWLIRRLAGAPASQANHIRDWFFTIESRRPLVPEERTRLWDRLVRENPVAGCKATYLAAAYRCLKAAYFKAHYPAEFRACLEVAP
jgi:hypothetical protein